MRDVPFAELEELGPVTDNIDCFGNRYKVLRWNEDDEAYEEQTDTVVIHRDEPGSSGLLWTYSSILRTVNEELTDLKSIFGYPFADAAERLAERATEWQRKL